MQTGAELQRFQLCSLQPWTWRKRRTARCEPVNDSAALNIQRSHSIYHDQKKKMSMWLTWYKHRLKILGTPQLSSCLKTLTGPWECWDKACEIQTSSCCRRLKASPLSTSFSRASFSLRLLSLCTSSCTALSSLSNLHAWTHTPLINTVTTPCWSHGCREEQKLQSESSWAEQMSLNVLRWFLRRSSSKKCFNCSVHIHRAGP